MRFPAKENKSLFVSLPIELKVLLKSNPEITSATYKVSSAMEIPINVPIPKAVRLSMSDIEERFKSVDVAATNAIAIPVKFRIVPVRKLRNMFLSLCLSDICFTAINSRINPAKVNSIPA